MEDPAGNLGEFSASDTLVFFDRPVPPLRGPIPAGASDDPSLGAFVLAFRDTQSWESALRAAISKIVEKCEAGARIGCSISASNKCRPPWWKSFFGVSSLDLAEREQCEEHEMSICIKAARESCIQFAKDKVLSPFRDARISSMDPKLYFSYLAKNNVEETNYRGNVLLREEICNELLKMDIR